MMRFLRFVVAIGLVMGVARIGWAQIAQPAATWPEAGAPTATQPVVPPVVPQVPYDTTAALYDFEAGWTLAPLVRAGCFTSYDRSGGNQDGFKGTYSVLYQLANGENVIVDLDGPGCLYTLWFTGPEAGERLPYGKIRFYLDGEQVPRLAADIEDLFRGRVPGFSPPLVEGPRVSTGGNVSYVPIPFARRLIITTEKRPNFYSAYYRLFPLDAPVVSWTGREELVPVPARVARAQGPKSGAAPGPCVVVEDRSRMQVAPCGEDARVVTPRIAGEGTGGTLRSAGEGTGGTMVARSLVPVVKAWNAVGTEPPPASGVRVHRGVAKSPQVTAPVEVLNIGEPGVIRWIRLTPVRLMTADALNTLRFQIYWDREQGPGVDVPVGPFFGSALGEVVVQSLPVGMRPGGAFYCSLPMPFARGGAHRAG